MQQPIMGRAAFHPHTAPFYEQRPPVVKRRKLVSKTVVKRGRKKAL